MCVQLNYQLLLSFLQHNFSDFYLSLSHFENGCYITAYLCLARLIFAHYFQFVRKYTCEYKICGRKLACIFRCMMTSHPFLKWEKVKHLFCFVFCAFVSFECKTNFLKETISDSLGLRKIFKTLQK